MTRFPSGEVGEAANGVSADIGVAVLVVSTEEILEYGVGGGEVVVERKCADQRRQAVVGRGRRPG